MTDKLDHWSGIEAFLAVAGARNFTRAASQMGVSVSFVSRRITALENYLGARLVARTTRTVSLTEAGRLFEERCRKLMIDRDAALEAVMAGGTDLRGPIRVTCSVAYGERKIVPILNRFALNHPEVTMEINLTNSVLDVISEGYDVAVRTGAVESDRLEAVSLTSRGRRLCASSHYLNNAGPLNSIQDLDNHPCLLGTSPEWAFTENGRQLLFRPRGSWRCNNGFGVLDAALQGMGVCQLPDFYVNSHLEAGTLVELLEDKRPADENVYAVYPKVQRTRRRIKLLVAHLVSEISMPSSLSERT